MLTVSKGEGFMYVVGVAGLGPCLSLEAGSGSEQLAAVIKGKAMEFNSADRRCEDNGEDETQSPVGGAKLLQNQRSQKPIFWIENDPHSYLQIS